MIAIAALCGAGVGLGIVLVIAGLRGIRFAQYFAPELTRLHATLIRADVRFTNVAIAMGVGLLVEVLTNWPVAGILGGLFAFSAPKLLGGKAASTEAIEKTEAIATWVEMLRDTMAAAAGIETAINATAPVSPLPIRQEVQALSSRLGRQSLSQALSLLAADLQHPTADLVVAALRLASRQQTSNLGELLSSLAQAARDDATMRMRIEAGRARTRTSVRVVVLATIGMATGLLLLNRNYLDPYNSAFGQLVLALVGMAFAGAFYWMDRMSRVQNPARIFHDSEVYQS